jgi:NAD(P)-dependent dehydrogenase (short-subunit alcohol dehydrogenase family)
MSLQSLPGLVCTRRSAALAVSRKTARLTFPNPSQSQQSPRGVPRMRSGGTIINIASVAGIVAGGSPHAYVAAKFGVVGLTKSVALELAERGIRVQRYLSGRDSDRDLGPSISRNAG